MANTMMEPIFWKKFPLCKLYPDSNIIGGSKMRKNIVGEKDSIRLVSASGRAIMKRPTMAPRKTGKKKIRRK